MESTNRKELLVVELFKSGFRGRDIKTDEIFSVKTIVSYETHRLDTVDFEMAKEWVFKKHKYASGKILSSQFINANIKAEELDAALSESDE